MVKEKPNIPLRARYKLADVKRILKVSYETLRKWRSLGYLRYSENSLGRKYYEGRSIIRLWEMVS